MPGVEIAAVKCPYCGESIELLVDPGSDGQDYIEDCGVCCRPIAVSVRAGTGGALRVELRHENEC